MTGAEGCAKALSRGRGRLLLIACDAAANTAAQAEAMARGNELVLLHTAFTKREIADAVGRGTPIAVALICGEGLADAFAKAVITD